MILKGWKEICEYTKLSVLGIKTLAKRKHNPFPLVYVARKAFVSVNLFTKWIETELENERKNK